MRKSFFMGPVELPIQLFGRALFQFAEKGFILLAFGSSPGPEFVKISIFHGPVIR